MPTRKASKANKAKGPLVFTAALFLATPLCMAEVAIASSDSSFGTIRPQYQQQTGLDKLKQSLPKTNLGSRLLPFSTSIPSLADISNLESTLSNLESQLKILKSQIPAVKPERLSQLETRIANLRTAISEAKLAQSTYLRASEALKRALKAQTDAKASHELSVVAKATAATSLTSKQAALTALEVIKASKTTSLANLQELFNNAQIAANNADASLTEQKEIKAQAEASLTIRQEQYSTATANLNLAQQTFNEASSEVEAAAQQLNIATQTSNDKQQVLNQAQQDYDTNLIPDPTWTVPTYQKENTRLVPYTEIQIVKTLVPTTTTRIDTQTIPNILFNSELNNTEGWSGVNAGWQGSSPALINNQITFSYMNQTVSQGLFSGPFQNATLTLSADWSNNDLNRGFVDTYSMTVEARDINQNPVGTATYNSTGSHGWDNKSVTLQATGPVSYITVSFTGLDAGFWYGIYGPTFKNPSLSISHGQEITETTYEEVITYEEVTKYREEIYYTTEPVLIEGTIQVKINEGGQATFTAPEGATFTGSNLRYEAISRPQCGININPPVQGKTQITIQASNGVWGDPCGGWYKHITGTLTYLGQPTAPLIKDPSLKVILDAAQADYDEALTNKQTAQDTYNEKLSTKNVADTQLELAQDELNNSSTNKLNAEDVLSEETSELNRLTTSNEVAQAGLATATQDLSTATQELNTAANNVTTGSSEVAAAELELSRTTNEEAAALTSLNSLSLEATSAQTTETSTASSASELNLKALGEVSTTQQDIATASTDTVPIPEPEPEQGSAEIPAVIENLMEVNLASVDPTELTPEQAGQLVEAALVAFETAVEGSPEYEQALDALYLAAEQDDIELPEELAAIPGLAGAVEVLNFLGNAGADMSPKVREESEKVVVATVVAAGAAIQSAAAAASTASAPSGGSRRVGK